MLLYFGGSLHSSLKEALASLGPRGERVMGNLKPKTSKYHCNTYIDASEDLKALVYTI